MSSFRFKWMINVCLIFIAGLYFWTLFSAALINDDYMALYTTWRMSIGDIANIDFNVDSYTLMFNLLAPIFTLLGERIGVIYIYRLILLLFIIGITIQLNIILRPFVSRNSFLIVILLLFLASPMYSRGFDVRPDLVILMVWLQIVLILDLKTKRENLKMLLIGVLLGIALLLKFKSLIVLVPIVVYLLYRFYNGLPVTSLIRSVIILVGGFLSVLMLYALVFGTRELTQLLQTSAKLIVLSASGGISTPGLKFEILKKFFINDFFFWVLFIFGSGIAFKRLRFYSTDYLLQIGFVFFLLVCSLLLNPHYYAYNLVTLYPLMAVFCAFSVQWFLDRLRDISNKKALLYITAMVLLIIGPTIGIVSFPLRNPIEYQFELQRFIEENTSSDEAVFAYEGIGLFRPSTYHWRTSHIMLRNYHKGVYNVWHEITEAKPTLVILSYRLPGWLLKEDKSQLQRHYTFIAPYVMTLGLETDSFTIGTLLKSGLYQINNSDNLSCELDGKEVENQSIHWLESGVHTLKSSSGRSIVRWYFSMEAIERLVKSNPNRIPYLIPPR